MRTSTTETTSAKTRVLALSQVRLSRLGHFTEAVYLIALPWPKCHEASSQAYEPDPPQVLMQKRVESSTSSMMNKSGTTRTSATAATVYVTCVLPTQFDFSSFSKSRAFGAS